MTVTFFKLQINAIKLSEYVIPDGAKRNSGISKFIALTISFLLS